MESSPHKKAIIQSLTKTLQNNGVFNQCVSQHLREIASQIESKESDQSNENDPFQQFAVDFVASYLDKNHLFDQLTSDEINDSGLSQKIVEELSNNKRESTDPFYNCFQIIENQISPKGKNKNRKSPQNSLIKNSNEIDKNSQYDVLKPHVIKRAVRTNDPPNSARANSPLRYTFGIRSPTGKSKGANFEEPIKKKKVKKSNKALQPRENPLSKSRINEDGTIEVTPQPIYINRKSIEDGKPQVVNLQFEINLSHDPLPNTPHELNSQPAVVVSPRKIIKSNAFSDDDDSHSPEIIKEEILAYIPQSPKKPQNSSQNNCESPQKKINGKRAKSVKIVKRKKKTPKNENSPLPVTERKINHIEKPPSTYTSLTTQTTSDISTQTIDDSPTLLKVSVIEAEVRGTSDGEAYCCQVEVDDDEKQTSFSKSRRPQWKKPMNFMVKNIFSDELIVKIIEKSDDDQYSISSLSIPLKNVALDDEINRWFDLKSDISKQDGGRIHLKLSAASIDYTPS